MPFTPCWSCELANSILTALLLLTLLTFCLPQLLFYKSPAPPPIREVDAFFQRHNWTDPDCDGMPWDAYGTPLKAVVLPLETPDGGGFANKLFVIAPGIVLAKREKLPLHVPSYYQNLAPCLRSSEGLERLLDGEGLKRLARSYPEGDYFHQHLQEWGKPLPAPPVFRRAFLPRLPRSFAEMEGPGAEDLVLHFRAMNGNWNWPWASRNRLAFPPALYFKQVVEAHAGKGKVWLVSLEREHPTLRRIARETKAEQVEKRPWAVDFAWLAMARHVAVSPSTYGWWAAYLGRAEVVHFPIMPGVVPMPWCDLMPHEDERYVFYDWLKGESWRGGKSGKMALERCRHYEQRCMERLASCPIAKLEGMAGYYNESDRKAG